MWVSVQVGQCRSPFGGEIGAGNLSNYRVMLPVRERFRQIPELNRRYQTASSMSVTIVAVETGESRTTLETRFGGVGGSIFHPMTTL